MAKKVPGTFLGLALLLLLSSLLGCRSTPEPIASAEPAWFAVLAPRAPAGAVAAADLVPGIGADDRTYVVIEDRGADGPAAVVAPAPDTARVNRAVRPTTRFGASWVLIEDDAREEYLALDDDGNVVLLAVIEHADRAISLFDPPLIVAYAHLPPGERRRVEVAMRVVDSSNPSRQRERGTAAQEVEYVGDQVLRTPHGEMIAQRVDMTFTADLGLADVTDRMTRWIIPGRGIAAEQRVQHVRMLGVMGRESTRSLMLDWEAE